MTPTERVIEAARYRHRLDTEGIGQETHARAFMESALTALDAAPAMTDEGREAAVEKVWRKYFAIRKMLEVVDIKKALGEIYDAGTQARQQPEAVERLVEAVENSQEALSPDYVINPSNETMVTLYMPSKVYMEARAKNRAVLASLPSETAKEPTEAEVVGLMLYWHNLPLDDNEALRKEAVKSIRQHRHLGAGGGKEKA